MIPDSMRTKTGFSLEALSIDDVKPSMKDLATMTTPQELTRLLDPPSVPRTTSSNQAQPSKSNSLNPPPELEALVEAFTPEIVEPRVPCFMIDTFVRNKNFFGRYSVLQDLDVCLLPSTELVVSSQPDRTRVALLCGLAGLGKTEVAIEYGYSRRDEFDAVFLIRADEPTKIEKDIAQIAARLGIQDHSDPYNTIVNKGLALGWLTDPFKVRDAHTDSAVSVPASWLLNF